MGVCPHSLSEKVKYVVHGMGESNCENNVEAFRKGSLVPDRVVKSAIPLRGCAAFAFRPGLVV